METLRGRFGGGAGAGEAEAEAAAGVVRGVGDLGRAAFVYSQLSGGLLPAVVGGCRWDG